MRPALQAAYYAHTTPSIKPTGIGKFKNTTKPSFLNIFKHDGLRQGTEDVHTVQCVGESEDAPPPA